MVKFIVPNPPGNVGDSVARMVAEQLGRNWKQSVIVENRSGANRMIGVEAAIRAPADGYTLLFSPGGNITAASALIPNLSFKPEAELVAVHRGVRVPVWMVVATGSPYKSLRDVVEAAKKAPGKLDFWSGGGQSDRPYFALTDFQRSAGIELGWVGYKVAADISAALALPELRARITAASVDIVESSPEEAARRTQADHLRWSALIKRLGIKPQ